MPPRKTYIEDDIADSVNPELLDDITVDEYADDDTYLKIYMLYTDLTRYASSEMLPILERCTCDKLWYYMASESNRIRNNR